MHAAGREPSGPDVVAETARAVHAAGREPSGPDVVAETARAFTRLLDSGWNPPLPGSGATPARWRELAALGATDLAVARLAEGHADAVAVLAELGAPAPPGRLGVWAAEPPGARVRAARQHGRWRLSGQKAWCSGARVLTDALVTAQAADGPRLFLVDLAAAGVTVDPCAWAGAGMVGADTADVAFDEVPAEPVGEPGDYVGRPGFWHGGIGVAAVWAGGARAVAGRLAVDAAGRGPLRAAAVGAADVATFSIEAALQVAAAEVDADPHDLAAARLRALRVRALVADAADEVLRIAGRALGAAPLAREREHSRRVADLTVYLRQHHAERDLAALGETVIATDPAVGER